MNEEKVGRLLVGRQVTVSVGEPWDFESPDGQGVLNGRIVGVDPGKEGDLRSQSLRIEVTPFAGAGGRRVTHLTATRRYADPGGIIEQVAAGEIAPANLDYGDQVGKEDLPKGASPFLIGSVRLAD